MTTPTRRNGSIRGTRTSTRRTDFARRWVPHTVTTTDRPLRRLTLAAAVLGVLVLSACGSESSDGDGDGDGGTGGGGADVSSAVRDGGEPADPTSPAARP